MPSHPRKSGTGKRTGHDTCQILRRHLVHHSTFNMATGETRDLGDEWVTEKCGTPLFTAEDRQRGECSACRAGWTHPHNYRV